MKVFILVSGLFFTSALCTSFHVADTDIPRYDHVVVVIEENHSYAELIGSPNAPYINELAKEGTLFTDSHGIGHPSQPNYLALFSGSTQGVNGDECLERNTF